MKYLRERRSKSGRVRYYFDRRGGAGGNGRRWIPLGSDLALAMRRYANLLAMPKPNDSVEWVVNDYLDDVERRPPSQRTVKASTLHLYRFYARNLAHTFNGWSIHDVTTADVMQYLDECPRTSARGEIAVLSMALSRAVRKRWLPANPCVGARSEKPRARRMRLLSDADVANVLAAARPELNIAIRLAYATGLRPGDVLELKHKDVASGAVVRTTKRGTLIRYQVTPELLAILEDARIVRGAVISPYVICGRGGRPITGATLRAWWAQACKRAGVVDAQFRDLRAKAASDAESQGVSPTALLGHEDARTTKTYLRGRRVSEVTPLRRKG